MQLHSGAPANIQSQQMGVNQGSMQYHPGFNQGQMNEQFQNFNGQHLMPNNPLGMSGNQFQMPAHQPGMSEMSLDANSNLMAMNDPKRTYRKKKTWCMNLKISIETPQLDHRLNEQFEIEIGSNQRLKILHQTILSQVKNMELRELIRKEKMYIYIEGKEPVARKSKSLAEMGVKDGDNLIVTTEMKLPLHEFSEDDDMDDPGMFPSGNLDDGFDQDDQLDHKAKASPTGFEMPLHVPTDQKMLPQISTN